MSNLLSLETLDKRRHFISVLCWLYTEGMEYTAGHLLHISRVKYRKICVFDYNYSGWM